MKKNDILYDAISKALDEKKQCKFSDIKQVVKNVLGEEAYSERQLRNVLYRLVKRGELRKSSDGAYYICNEFSDECNLKNQATIVNEDNVLESYIKRMMKICHDEEKKLANPFEKFSENEIIGAKKVYELNKKIMNILNQN